jgi:integrase
MPKTSYGSGSLFQRGSIWYVAYFIDGRQVQKSSRSSKRQDAERLRAELLGRKVRGETIHRTVEKIRCDELLNDFLENAEKRNRPSTVSIWRIVTEANVRPFFGHLKAATLTTEKLKEYRRKRLSQGRAETTINRELSILRMAFNLGRKCTPVKVVNVPYFPMARENNVRQGFLTDEQYITLRGVLPDYLKPLFVTAYFTGVRRGELLAWRWEQVDFEQGFVTLAAEETKSGYARAVPILKGDMHNWLLWAKDNANGGSYVFHHLGKPIKQFRGAWKSACAEAGVPDLKFHDLRRTAVRNMRRAGVPQVVRMRISGHRTDSMERRYNIVDVDDLRTAKELMERVNSFALQATVA